MAQLKWDYRRSRLSGRLCFWVVISSLTNAVALITVHGDEKLHYSRDVEPIVRKYCGSCHNDVDREGELSLASYQSLRSGTPDGAIVVEGKPSDSKLILRLLATDDSKMPPAKEAQPTVEEIGIIKLWIEQGASAPEPLPLSQKLRMPKLPADPKGKNQATASCAVGSKMVAVGRFGKVDFIQPDTRTVVWTLDDLPGKVNQLRTSSDGRLLVVSTGIAGLGGEVVVVDIERRTVVMRLEGHSDSVYCAAMSADGRWIASGSYDRSVHLWDLQTGKIKRSFVGHNGAIYDLDFDPSDKMLATASADQTIKLWSVERGERMDTLGQGEGEMLAVRFVPKSNELQVVGAGKDRQIRLWRIVSTEKPAINPMLLARFAHESAITRLEWVAEREIIVTTSDDRTAKTWHASNLQPMGAVATCSDTPMGIAAGHGGAPAVWITDLAGKMQQLRISSQLGSIPAKSNSAKRALAAIGAPVKHDVSTPIQAIQEAEPNDAMASANELPLPVRIEGAIDSPTSSSDSDLFRFAAKAGEQWVFEVAAERNKSSLDSSIDILDARGEKVVRTLLQATRASYFTFRGKDSLTNNDFRMHNWEEMELNELLYSDGEVVKLWLYPRGPDSGFIVYPGFGNRKTYFDTTPIAHALGAPAYIVREIEKGEQPLPNGLPIFPIYYENDDDALRRAGRDSRLTFTCPEDGNYFVRVRDARGFSGVEYRYQLTIRRPQPDFEISVTDQDMVMPIGSGREWQVTAKRIDGLEGPIEIHLENLPNGFMATNPLIVEQEQEKAYGTVFATVGAPLLAGQDAVSVDLVARSKFGSSEIEHRLKTALSIKLTDKKEVQFKLVDAVDGAREIEELLIRPGESISAKVVVERHGFSGRIGFGKEDAGRNLPHGSYVDNIGLNGLLIVEQSSEREFFITASPETAPQERVFHLQTDTAGKPTSRPILLKVLPAKK